MSNTIFFQHLNLNMKLLFTNMLQQHDSLSDKIARSLKQQFQGLSSKSLYRFRSVLSSYT